MTTYHSNSTLNNITTNINSSLTGNTITLTSTPVTGSVLNYGALSGSVTSAAGTYSTTWTPPTQNFISNNGSPLMTVPYNEEKIVLEKAATLEVKGTVVINGIDLEERLKTIEKVLQIPERDVIMEAKYPKLANLYQQYMHELERYKTWDRIKGNEDGTT